MAKAARGANLETEIDELFQLPLAEFTKARNTLAGRLKKAGRREDADRVKAMLKPTAPAWAVNQVYWRRRDAFDRLLAAGERFRKAQAAQLEGRKADLRGALDARRTTLAELTKLAADTLRQNGGPPTPDALRRITTTLEALSTYGTHPGAPRAGRLTEEVDPPGFETLAALVPVPGDTPRGDRPTRVIPFQSKRKPRAAKAAAPADPKQAEQARKTAQAAARAALQEAERTLREARQQARLAEEALKKAAARAKAADQAKADAEARLDKAAAAADAARVEARKVAAGAEDAAQAVADAERALDTARQALERLEA